MYPLKHENGKIDYRYQITQEYPGFEYLKHVVRFCDDWIGCFETKEQAIQAAIKHNRERLEKL